MLDRWTRTVVWLIYGCLACLVTSAVNVNADGRVFVLDLRSSAGPQGFRDAERACASQHARLASAEDLRHAVVECFFSQCTRGWLYGGTVGSTVCNVAGSAINAVDVRTENATEDTADVDAFCIKDKGVPCGDPPSFPNARLQGRPGFEMGDELLYTCVPGYVMPSGHTAFSLLCDSCGEWYGLVQICVKDGTESHIDYEDKFTDSYEEEEHHSERPEEAHGEVYEEVHGTANPEGRGSQEQQETSFGLVERQDEHGDDEAAGELIGSKLEGDAEEKDEDRAVEDFTGHPRWEQERGEVVRIDAAAATEAPVSLLSQKHMFWFPSEAFQEEGHSTNPVTQTTQRVPGTQSEESEEHESQEAQHPVDVDDGDHEQDGYDDHDTDDGQDHDDSRHYDQPDRDSHQDEDDHDDHPKHYIPAHRDDRHEKHNEDDDDPNDHYDMGEHEEDRVRYSSQEYDDPDETYEERESQEDRRDVTDDHGAGVQEHAEDSKEHADHHDHDDGEEHYDREDSDGFADHHEHDNDDHDHDDHDHDDHDSYGDHDSHEDYDDGRQRVIVSIATDVRNNGTAKGEKATTDDTWLDGYPVVVEEAGTGDSTTERVRPQDGERGTLDRPNEVEIRRPVPYTSLPEEHESPTSDPEQGVVKDVWPGFIPTHAPSHDHIEPSDSPSYSDTLDYDTQEAAPTRSWQGDLTEHPFLDYGLAPPVHDGDVPTEEHTVHNLSGETGEREDVEGEMGEAICVGDDCPPGHPQKSPSKGATITVIIVALCALAAAVVVGVWCYRRQQQKSSMYEMNGKGQSPNRQGQQIEMQQKV